MPGQPRSAGWGQTSAQSREAWQFSSASLIIIYPNYIGNTNIAAISFSHSDENSFNLELEKLLWINLMNPQISGQGVVFFSFNKARYNPPDSTPSHSAFITEWYII